ncbi:LLM class flavin-dependent oxidoreductase [Amycolatopsis granulosa]|uniref:LLM class flavin-dependent oxidoreductase n=1 Tax=Amycolatopsis granulosa TaxID=185684 RepID=UPI0014237DDE|nr:LLM class flavin-dependent oxidoreductase [Amycolatopsis granulosa]NIH83598.1 alkanesulfonate monooxygenase SsuD/methylene tetrahydromethanopterin reductase-like flavin-dependent oxidoreductase (luciferase family) [Amycolatopsis granulosa]
MTPVDIGVMLPRDLPAAEIVPFARRAEELGFGELWVVEDLGFHGGIAQAATVLAVTGRIRVGIGILPAGARSVAFTAMEFATLARLHPGRVVAGIGHGMPDWMRQAGAWPASPLTLFTEYAQALTALLRGKRVRVAGRYVRLDGVALESPPDIVPPVLAGVRGPKSLAIAGAELDGVVLAEPAPEAYLAGARRFLPAHARVVAFEHAAVHDDADTARALVRPRLDGIADPALSAHVESLPFAAELRALAAGAPGTVAGALRPEWVDALALAGPAPAVRRRITALAAAGATSVVLIPVAPDRLAALGSLAAVLPASRG